MRISDRESAPSIISEFTDDAGATVAVQRLRAGGIDDRFMSITRQAARASASSDAPALSRVFWSGFWWSVAGAALGVALGLVVGLLDLGVPGTFENIGLQIASWAMFFHVLGALLGCYLVLDTGDRFSRTDAHHDIERTLLRVRVTDASHIERVTQVLRDVGGTIQTAPNVR